MVSSPLAHRVLLIWGLLLLLAGAVSAVDNNDTAVVDGECTAGSNSTLVERWSEKNIQDVVALWKLDSEAEAKLKQLGESVSDVDHWKNDPYEAVRFLDDFNMDVKKSEEMLRKMVQWRLANNIDTLLERWVPHEVLNYSPMVIMRGLDKEGDPVFVQRHGSLDSWGMYQAVGGDVMLDAANFLGELMSARDKIPDEYQWQRNYYEPLTGRRFTQFTCILDLEGLHAGKVRPAILGLLKENSRIAQDMYPGFQKRAIVIRAPRIFRWAWSIIKHFYDQRALDKFDIVTSDNYLEYLDKFVDRENLPSVIDPVHGKGKPMPGYFEKVHIEGGKVPAM